MQVVGDLHLHSKYSRAVSPQMTPPVMAYVGKQKGIDILGTGDWTHPLWFREIKNFLTEAEEGLFKIKTPEIGQEKTRFLLSVEISNIYSQAGKGRRIHNLVWSPSFETCEKINKELVQRGCNITSDGRPIIGLSSKNLLEVILEIDQRCMLIPCHVWTPWFGIYGMSSGFNSLEECFGNMSEYIYAIETGLSSDPEMNWQIEELDTRSIVSFSDAHSPAKMGREATVFDIDKLSYDAICNAVKAPMLHKQNTKTIDKIAYTIEFYPEEGKYHYSGHRNCQISLTPEEQKKTHDICPICGKKITDGVMRRVQELAQENPRGVAKVNEKGLKWIIDPDKIHPPFVKIVPLNEIISEAIGSPVTSPKVKIIFDKLCEQLDSEFYVLLKAPLESIAKVAGTKIAEGVQKVREANIAIKPGYDGLYGIVKIWHEQELETQGSSNKEQVVKKQLNLEL